MFFSEMPRRWRMVLLSTLGNLVHLFFVFSQGNAVEKVPQRYHTTRGCPKKATNRIESLFFGTPCTSDIKDFIAGSSKWDALLPIKGKHIANHTVASLQFSFLFFWIVYISRSGTGVKLMGRNPKCTKKILVGDFQFLTHRFRVLSVTNWWLS